MFGLLPFLSRIAVWRLWFGWRRQSSCPPCSLARLPMSPLRSLTPPSIHWRCRSKSWLRTSWQVTHLWLLLILITCQTQKFSHFLKSSIIMSNKRMKCHSREMIIMLLHPRFVYGTDWVYNNFALWGILFEQQTKQIFTLSECYKHRNQPHTQNHNMLLALSILSENPKGKGKRFHFQQKHFFSNEQVTNSSACLSLALIFIHSQDASCIMPLPAQSCFGTFLKVS